MKYAYVSSRSCSHAIHLRTHLCTAAGGGPPSPTQVVISAGYSGWSFASTNLTLTLTNGVYAAGAHTVAPKLISNLMAAARKRWPKPAGSAPM